ncbi:MAG: M1 family aminopeptidase [Polyangiales bacterium]
MAKADAPGSHVALLRGINVGGKNKLRMTDLAALFAAEGCSDVRTYIQSGNVVYRAPSRVTGRLPERIAAAIEKRFDLRVPVVTRTAAELNEAVRSNPFVRRGADPASLHVAFLADTPTAKQIATLDPTRSLPDELAVRGREIFLCLPNGVARTKLTNAYFDSKLSTTSTIRNLRTVLELCKLIGLLALLASGCASARSSAGAAPTRAAPTPASDAPPKGKLPRDVRPSSYSLELEIAPERETFSGTARIAVDLSQSTSRVWLHARGLHVSAARAKAGEKAVAASFRQVNDEGVARLDFESPLPAGKAVLELVYDAPFGAQLAGLYRVRSDGKAYAFTQFEPVSAREAFPCFDEPAFKTPFDVTLTVGAADVAIANTPELASEPLPDGRKRVRFATTRPLPTYLVAFIVGPFDVVQAEPIARSEVRPGPLPLRGVAAAGKGAALKYTLEHAAPLLLELERYFGIAYPYPKLDLIAVPDFDAGAMENAGAITFRESILLFDGEHAAESQLRRYANIVAHEVAHHWTGDLVTMPWWDDTWLNEAFATFMATRTVAAVHPEYHAEVDLLSSALWVMDGDSRVSARKIRQPIESTHDIVNAFDGITYQKGAAVLAMFERFLGEETFRRGVQAYLRAHADGNADAAALLAALSAESGKDVTSAMGSFLDQVGVPLITAELRCDAGRASLSLRQSRYLPAGSTGESARSWQVPVCARYGVRGVAHESCVLLSEPAGDLELKDAHGTCPDWVMPNAGGAGYYRFALPARDLAKLGGVGFAALSVRERLSFADSLHAGFESGALDARSVLAALPALAADADRNVATVPMGLLRFARDYLLEPAERPALERFARSLYAGRLQRLGYAERAGESGDARLLRASLAWFLSDTARDPGVRAQLAKLGRAYLAGAGAKSAELAADLRTPALVTALQDGDRALFDDVLVRMRRAGDSVERDRLLSALCSVTDARSEQVLALSLDPGLHVNEVFTPIRMQLGDERTRQAAWQFLEQHFDALVERVSKQHGGWLPGLAWAFCSNAMADHVQAFFGPKIAGLSGGPRSLSSAVEGLHLCAAQVDMQRAGAKAFFAGSSGRASL